MMINFYQTKCLMKDIQLQLLVGSKAHSTKGIAERKFCSCNVFLSLHHSLLGTGKWARQIFNLTTVFIYSMAEDYIYFDVVTTCSILCVTFSAVLGFCACSNTA